MFKSARRQSVDAGVVPGMGEPAMPGEPETDPRTGKKKSPGRKDSGESAEREPGRSSVSGATEAANQLRNLAESGTEINVQTFDELVLPSEVIESAQSAWSTFLKTAGSKDAAGEAIYSAIFEGAPSLQTLFVTPRAVQAVRFMTGINSLITALSEPARLKILVETLGFAHLNFDVTVPRVVVFRDAILDLFEVELAHEFNATARKGVHQLLNYVGGALIYVRAHYSGRFKTLSDSWAFVNKKRDNNSVANKDDHDGDEKSQTTAADPNVVMKTQVARKQSKLDLVTWRRWCFRMFDKGSEQVPDGSNGFGQENLDVNVVKTASKGQSQQASIPTTYPDMFRFNAAVMGFGASHWMNEVLDCFDTIVNSVSNSARMQDECNILVLRLAKFNQTNINLAEYKSCMLASLRSLLPKAWDSAHEVAWSWLWEIVERLLKKVMGNPPVWEKKIKQFLRESLDDNQLFEFRKEVYARFFTAAPAGQDYFKQSNTYLHVIIDKVLEMTIGVFENPIKLLDDISALGLRHVGYGIPTELFGPFVTAAIEVAAENTTDEGAIDAFRWSCGLISNILVRTIIEGSTIVMKAIDANSAKALRKAVQGAPRAGRAACLLVVQVGTQSISPLSWSLTSGCLESAKAIIEDLLTIRADRERYYFGVDDLFGHHPDIVQRLIVDAPSLLPTLWQCLVWRCPARENQLRRVNYYIRHLVVDNHGGPSKTLQWLTEYKDPQTMCDCLIVFVADLFWKRVSLKRFAMKKAWFLLSLAAFMFSQVILPKLQNAEEMNIRCTIFAFRCINYGIVMVRLIGMQLKRIVKGYLHKDTMKVCKCIPAPAYLRDAYEMASFLLMLLLCAMLANEPMLWCMLVEEPNDPEFPTEHCDEAQFVMFRYSVFCMLAMALQWFLIVDVVTVSTQLTAFMLVVKHVMSELGRFMVALLFLLLTFGSAISVLEHHEEEFQTVAQSSIGLFAITVKLYQDDYRGVDEPALVVAVFCFQTSVTILLMNLLIAQLQCSYEFVSEDAVGLARLKRSAVIAESLPTLPAVQFEKFVASCQLDTKLEFNEGDIGFSGGMQIKESARIHPIVEDTILRFGGSCSPEEPWQEDEEAVEEEEDKFDRMERLLQKTIKRMVKTDLSSRSGGGSGGENSHGASHFSGSSGSSDGSVKSERSGSHSE